MLLSRTDVSLSLLSFPLPLKSNEKMSEGED